MRRAVALLHHRKDGRVRKVELSACCLPLLCSLASRSVLQEEVENVESYRAKNQQDKTGNSCREPFYAEIVAQQIGEDSF